MVNDLDRGRFPKAWFGEWAPDPPVFDWATELLNVAIRDQPDAAWDLILILVERAPHDDALGWVGAGPLEDLLCEHGPIFIERAEVIANGDERFRKCLSRVWGSNRMEPGVYERMCQAAPGPRGERP